MDKLALLMPGELGNATIGAVTMRVHIFLVVLDDPDEDILEVVEVGDRARVLLVHPLDEVATVDDQGRLLRHDGHSEVGSATRHVLIR